ncbi:hypothetical protein [Streptomyces sp. ISID311]|uniref:hypothetical protein n=1 Tax=Streptomyces sp. ISID311 TaxID=2601673 RepID=UPI0011BD2FFC|nr:hypothetical protein [Streptomyces sp. ISID311]TXC92468.1 hypothetical protein FS847_32800 [Streptomyces sp. ISID311]
MSENNGEAVEEMPTEVDGQGRSDGGSLLYGAPPALGDPNYSVALDLLMMVIGRCTTEIGKEESRPQSDRALLSRYKNIEAACYKEQAELREYDQDHLLDAISRYRRMLNEIWPYQNGEPA